MKYIILCIAAFLPSVTLAHGKWLVPEYQNVITNQHGAYTFYSFSSIEVWVWICISIGVVFAASIMHKYTPEWSTLTLFAERNKIILDRIAQCVLGIFLVSTAFFWNVVILPTELVTTPVLEVLKILQIVIGFMFILHILPRYASIGLLILSLSTTISNGIEAVWKIRFCFHLLFIFILLIQKEKTSGLF